MARQAEAAIEFCDAVVLVVDSTVGITNTDEQLVRLLRRSKRPVILAANKVDSPMHTVRVKQVTRYYHLREVLKALYGNLLSSASSHVSWQSLKPVIDILLLR